MLVFSIILWALSCLVVLLLAAVFSPVRLNIHATAEPHPRLIAHARLFGGIAPSLRIIDSERKKPKKPKTEKNKKSHKTRGSFNNGPALVQDFIRAIAEILRKIHVEHLSLNIKFGLGDPAETGHLYGLLTPLVYGTNGFARSSIHLQPNFEQRCLSGDLDAQLRFIPGSLAFPVIGFVWTNFGPMR